MDVEYFRELLLKRRQGLKEHVDIGQAAAETVELDQARQGRLSRMDALQGQAMSQATELRRQQELQNIATALERIDTGDYGYCEQCGEQIIAARLEIEPAVSLCVQCAEKSQG